MNATTEYERIIAHAATAAVKQAAIAGRDAGRAAMGVAGFKTPRWKNAIVYAMRPKRGDSLTPWAWVHSTINFADVLEEGRTISGDPWLWIPLPQVPLYPGDPSRRMTAKMYVATVGPLRKARRRGMAPLLLGLASPGTTPPTFRWTNTASGKFLKPSARGLKGGIMRAGRVKPQWIPMFVGVHSATIEKKMSVVPAIESAANLIPEFYVKNLEAYEGRK